MGINFDSAAAVPIINVPAQNALQAIFPMKYGPMALSLAIWPLAMIHTKI